LKLLKQIIRLQPLEVADNKLKISTKIYGLGLLVLAIFTIFKMIAANYDLYANYSHPASESLKSADSILMIFYILLISVFIHPLLEELSFRLWLSKNRYRFLLGLGFCLIFFTLIFTDFNRLLPISPELSFNLSFVLLGVTLGYLLIKIVPKKLELPRMFILIIISSILFALLHLNVIGKQNNLLGYLIILLPYFIKGYFYGYITFRIGFRYAFFAHALHNFTLLFMTLMIR
jgi:membrane protease YdiL (CAAX protease family)